MSDMTPTSPSGPPADWYDDPDGSGRQRFYDGAIWTDHFRSAPAAQQQPIQVTVQAPVQTDSKKARDKAVYTRQQKGHSWILHWVVLGIFSLFIVPIYYTVSPNHYWHL